MVLCGTGVLELDLHKNEFVIVDIDDVVLDTGVTEIRLPGNEFSVIDAVQGLEP